MSWQDLGVVVGAISGVCSLAAVVYLIGVWKGRVDADRAAWNKTCDTYPLGEIWTMCKTMWDILVVDSLHRREDLATRKSPYRLTEKGTDLIPQEIKTRLDLIRTPEMSKEDIFTGWLVVKTIGLEDITDMAMNQAMSLPEAAAILSTYLSQRLCNNHTGG